MESLSIQQRIEENKSIGVNGLLTNQVEYSGIRIITLVLKGFKNPFIIAWPHQSENFEHFWRSSKIDQEIDDIMKSNEVIS